MVELKSGLQFSRKASTFSISRCFLNTQRATLLDHKKGFKVPNCVKSNSEAPRSHMGTSYNIKNKNKKNKILN